MGIKIRQGGQWVEVAVGSDLTRGSSLVRLGTTAVFGLGEAAFTNIPSIAKKIIVSMYRFSFTGTTDDFIMEVGDSTGYVQSGYQSSYDNRDASPDAKYRTNAYGIADDTWYAWEYNINIELVNVSGNSWVITHMGGNNDNDSTPGAILYGGGSITLSNALDKLRIKTVNGRTLDNGEVTVYYETASDPSSSGSSVSRQTFSGSTSSTHADDADERITIAAYKSYSLLKLNVSHPAWVRIYPTTTARTADASRTIAEDPTPGSGVIAEAITTTTNEDVLFTPALMGFNDDSTPSTNVYLAIMNKTGGVQSITVTMTTIQLET